jgi:hypothetical protein
MGSSKTEDYVLISEILRHNLFLDDIDSYEFFSGLISPRMAQYLTNLKLEDDCPTLIGALDPN